MRKGTETHTLLLLDDKQAEHVTRSTRRTEQYPESKERVVAGLTFEASQSPGRNPRSMLVTARRTPVVSVGPLSGAGVWHKLVAHERQGVRLGMGQRLPSTPMTSMPSRARSAAVTPGPGTAIASTWVLATPQEGERSLR